MSTNKKITLKENQETGLEKEVMSKIASGEVVMKPKWYFITGSFFMLFGTIALTVAAIFLINLTIFFIKKQGPGYGKIMLMFNNFPIWIPILAVIGIGVGILLLRKYDFSYKKNFSLIVFGFVASIIIAGFAIDALGLNDVWSKRGPIRNLYQGMEYRNNGPIQNIRGGRYNRN